MLPKVPKQPPRAKPRSTTPRAEEPTPFLEQRHLDLLGLALIAFGVLIAVPLFRAGAGGVIGEAVADGARVLLGATAIAAPILAIAGGLVAVSPISATATVRMGGGALAAFGSVALIARAAEGPDTGAVWATDHLAAAGGALGELLWTACFSAFGTFGPYVVAVVMMLGAALLLTGAEIAAVGAGAGRGLARALGAPGRMRAQRRAEAAMALADHSPAAERAAGEDLWPIGDPSAGAAVPADVDGGTITATRRAAAPPEPVGVAAEAAPRTWTSFDGEEPIVARGAGATGEISVVRLNPREVQLVDGAERFPDLYGGDGPIWIGPDEPSPAPPRAREPFPDPLADFEAELRAADAGEPESDDDAAGAAELGEDAPGLRVFDGDAVDETPEAAELDAELFREAPEPEAEAWEQDDPEDPAASGGPVGPEALTPMGRYRAEVTDDPNFAWRIPPRRLLTRSPRKAGGPSRGDQQQTAQSLLEALGHLGVKAELVGCVAGPHITRYELRLAPGVKMNKVANLKDDLAYALAATDIRILAPIPGKTAVGVEVPNRDRAMVRLGDVFSDAPPKSSPLTVWLGQDVEGQSIFADLAKMPHLLVAGTTGAGKSGCINAMLSSILLTATPHDLRMVLVDPKQVELTPYESIPHLLTPVITSPKMAATALQNLVREMEARYSTMALARTRNLPELNRVRRERGETEFPYILCVIDELADLMMVAPGEVEDSIIRLAQKARAVGIHLVLATQTPRVDVITGMIKANVPSRIAFAVSSQTDSRVILDQNGAESLLGQGDMLFAPVGSARLQRIQGAYIDEEQIEQITAYWRKQGEPEFRDELLEEIEDAAEEESKGDGLDPDEDPMLEEAVRLVVEMGTASTSMMQRRLRVGYTRAGRLIDMLERRGVISGYEGSKARQVLIGPGEVERIVAQIRDRKSSATPTLFQEQAASSDGADDSSPDLAAAGQDIDEPSGSAPDVGVAADDADR